MQNFFYTGDNLVGDFSKKDKCFPFVDVVEHDFEAKLKVRKTGLKQIPADAQQLSLYEVTRRFSAGFKNGKDEEEDPPKEDPEKTEEAPPAEAAEAPGTAE